MNTAAVQPLTQPETDIAIARHATIATVIGELTLVAEGDALIGIYYPGHWVGIERAALGEDVSVETDAVLLAAASEIREYLAGERTAFDIPIDLRGSDFDQQVWAMLREIPYGETVTYGDLADRLGNRMLARKVGRAVGYNPLSIIVPCHRVVGAGGKLTGYAGGIERKQFLLAVEEPAETSAERLF